VDPEEKEVEEERNDNESNDSISEMSIKVGLLSVMFYNARPATHHSMALLYIQNLP